MGETARQRDRVASWLGGRPAARRGHCSPESTASSCSSPATPAPPPGTHLRPAAQGVPEGLRGHSLVQRLPQEGLQVPEERGCVHHQLPGGVALRQGSGGGGLSPGSPFSPPAPPSGSSQHAGACWGVGAVPRPRAGPAPWALTPSIWSHVSSLGLCQLPQGRTKSLSHPRANTCPLSPPEQSQVPKAWLGDSQTRVPEHGRCPEPGGSVPPHPWLPHR